ncbi:hypothetical protein PMI05_04372 [Brevibacillus sp. BC25]|nr:hypothetical protein PMI05_04372 [Brevibacillus sp. BC25]
MRPNRRVVVSFTSIADKTRSCCTCIQPLLVTTFNPKFYIFHRKCYFVFPYFFCAPRNHSSEIEKSARLFTSTNALLSKRLPTRFRDDPTFDHFVDFSMSFTIRFAFTTKIVRVFLLYPLLAICCPFLFHVMLSVSKRELHLSFEHFLLCFSKQILKVDSSIRIREVLSERGYCQKARESRRDEGSGENLVSHKRLFF